MKYRGLIDSFSRIEAGDLLSCIAVMDEANKILGALSPDERTDKELLHHVIDKISTWMRDGFGEERITERDDLISALEKINSAGDDEEDADYDLVMSFISESQTHLEDIESRLLSMETQQDPELVNGVFRSIHTIKGVSSFLGLPRVKTLSHALETVLDEIRNEKRSVDSELIDILLEGCDRLTAFVDALGVWAQAVEPSHPGRLTEPDVVIEDVLDRLNSLNKSDGPLYTQEMIDNFVQESLEILDSAEKALMDLDEGAGRESLNEAFRGIHTIKGNAGFFEQEDVGRFCQSLESVMDGMRQGDRTIGAGAVTGLLDGVDALRVHLRKLSSDGDSDGASQGDEMEEQAPLTLGKVLVDMGAVQPEDVDAALDAQGRRIGEILIDNGVVAESTIQEALNVQSARSRKAESGMASSTKRDVRVDTGRLDLLFTLIGELITAHAMVINNPELDDLELPEFDKASSSMGKIIRDIQSLSMSIRMIPLDGLFSKMRRLSRDLSRKFGKSAEFLSKGEDTEMDRQIIEQISDPLVHLVRNAIDHGLEDKKTRVTSGKNESGIIELSARYEGNEVWISVRDDGGGLDRERILSRAGERGIDIGDDGGASMDDKAVWALIFEPGFSTAETVSDVSGRGVGMDVVRRNIEQLRGQVSVDSTQGIGTTITLQIPMTLAIIDGITFLSGGILFALPIADILEFHRPVEDAITEAPGGRRILRLRDQLLPIITLEDYYHLDKDQDHEGSDVFIILGSGNRRAAVPADELLGNQQLVIKSLPPRLRDVRALSGCAILGNGDVCMILDAGYLLSAVLGGDSR